MKRGNPAKLVPNSALTPQERKEKASKAGKASGASRRRQKNLREAINSLLSQKVNVGNLQENESISQLMENFGLGEEDTVTALTAAAMVRAAIAGSPQHAKLLIDMTEEESGKRPMPAKIEITFEDNSEETSV